ncbi:MAG: DUF2797 domain-containing protein [Bacteroidetes bacterium]|jgi:hypothetical protein|nr:DUF2797 domain-containing protein [Bacteroidota bacterium]MDA0980013.1 DUF2797 domain-containing protein [Bacteroidota bacterium]
MILSGNIRKMIASPSSEIGGIVGYQFQMYDVLEQLPSVDMNDWVGRKLSWRFEGVVNCVVSGENMKQAYRMGMSQKAFFESPISCPSIINPELSTIHTGVALRDREFEERYHNVPHIVYLSRTNKLKVGVTGFGREQFRWNDQGAVEGIILCVTPYRQLAGEIEVALKEHMNDKTHWLGMLKDVSRNPDELLDLKDECFDILGMNYEPFFSDEDTVYAIHYPVEHYPAKVMSIKLEKEPEGSGVLSGIKGQYLIFKDGRVMNVRAHEGCRVELEVG